MMNRQLGWNEHECGEYILFLLNILESLLK